MFLVNLFLGWTVVMWISLMIESFQDPTISRYSDAEDNEFENDTTLKNEDETNKLVNEFSKFTPTKPIEVWYRNLK